MRISGRIKKFLRSRNFWVCVTIFLNILLVPAWQVLYVGAFDPGEGARRGNLKLSEVSPEFQRAVWVVEDRQFLNHNGFDWVQIRLAWRDSRRSGNPPRGASTITQQCARSVFLWQGRSWIRKGFEAYYTFWMEQLLEKERIFELYVNSIEFGVDIFGIESAARHFYDCSAEDLTREEAAMLAAIMPAPRKWNPLEPTERVKRRQAMIIEQTENAPYPFQKYAVSPISLQVGNR